MWKRCGRSAALDRAEALMSAQKNRGDAGSARGSAARSQGSADGSAPPNRRISFADLSDLSSSSSAPEHGAPTAGSAAAREVRVPEENKDPTPQNSFGAGSRFLKKKGPPPATNSHHSPVNMDELQQKPIHRNASTSVRGSQNAALSGLTQIQSRISSRKQTGQEPKTVENLTSRFGISPPPAAQSQSEDSVELSEESKSDQSPKGKRFLKKKISAAVNNSEITAVLSPESPDAGARSTSRAAGVSSAGLETKRLVNLDSDEEDMRKLLGDSFDSDDNSLIPEIRPSTRREDQMSSKGRQRDESSPPPATGVTSSASNGCSISSPSPPPCRSSPFRFSGQDRAHFIPTAPIPPPSPPGRQNSPPRAGSPQRSLSSMSGRSNVVSLEELFSAGPGSEVPHSEMSDVSSEDFKIKLMLLDDLMPADFGFREGSPGKEARLAADVSSPLNAEQQQEEEEDYESDFGNVGSAVVSERLERGGDEEVVGSEVTEGSSMTSGRTAYDYSNTFSESSDSGSSPTSDETLSRRKHSQSSRSTVSHPHQSRRRDSPRMVSKDAAVQTEAGPVPDSWHTGMGACGPSVGLTYSDSTPVVAHTLGAEMVEALSTFNPAAFVLNDLLKQQLAIIRRSVESSRYLHYSLVQSLGPPNYRYTMLEDTREYIRHHRPQTDDGALT